MKIKRLNFDAPIRFQDVRGEYQVWSGLPLANRVDFITLKEKAEYNLLRGGQWELDSILALKAAGFEEGWFYNSENQSSLIQPLLFGSVDTEGVIPGIIEANEFPYKFSDAVRYKESSSEQKLERFDQIWLTLKNGQRIIVNPLTGNQRRQADGYRYVISQLDGNKAVRKAYDFDIDFRYCCDEILNLYGVPGEQITISQMIELLFDPGWIHSIETPLMQYVGGSPVPEDENPYDAAIASIWLSNPKVPLTEHLKLMDSIPWVQVQSLLNSANSIVNKEKSEEKQTSKTHNKTKAKPSSSWKKNEFDNTKYLLEKLKSGEAEIKPMSKMQQRVLGG